MADIKTIAITALVTSVVQGIVGKIFNGKNTKKAIESINRKNNVYQPLINSLEPISSYCFDILMTIDYSFLEELVENSYKYGLNVDLNDKCTELLNIICEYKKINIFNAAHNVIVKQFEQGFKGLYGYTVDGTIYHTEYDGTEWEEEHEVEELGIIKTINIDKEIKTLLQKQGAEDYVIYIDNDIDNDVYVYSELVSIYSSALNATINGEKFKRELIIKEWKGTPSEYIAYRYDFFEQFDKEERVINKYKLREEIILKSQEIIQDLKEIIAQIVKKYEKEVI
jgi:hypothetical protein